MCEFYPNENCHETLANTDFTFTVRWCPSKLVVFCLRFRVDDDTVQRIEMVKKNHSQKLNKKIPELNNFLRPFVLDSQLGMMKLVSFGRSFWSVVRMYWGTLAFTVTNTDGNTHTHNQIRIRFENKRSKIIWRWISKWDTFSNEKFWWKFSSNKFPHQSCIVIKCIPWWKTRPWIGFSSTEHLSQWCHCDWTSTFEWENIRIDGNGRGWIPSYLRNFSGNFRMKCICLFPQRNSFNRLCELYRVVFDLFWSFLIDFGRTKQKNEIKTLLAKRKHTLTLR